ncbi:MAG: penicillin acylase family protein [Pirellulaceae bacterium]|nr:penicillin acylase family protein [Pirellulaceae bacterium]
MKHWLVATPLIPLLTSPLVRANEETVEILRDQWGIPHVFAQTDAGAWYGLGYATAEDRAFQMTYNLRIIQGRLSEVVGEVRHLNRNETSVDHDRKMRTFGFHRAARRTADNLDPETRELLQAYCDGVNRYFDEHRDRLHPLFSQTALEPEEWTPADCLASWWNLGRFFATDGTRDLIAGRNDAAGRTPGRPADLELTSMPPDEEPAVVKRTDVPVEWIDRVQDYASRLGLTPGGSSDPTPKFSHAWAVGGNRTTTGSSVLVSDPQTPVRNPSLFYEWHVQGKTFNARGVGVPGSPVLLIGFTDRVAWGMTALGADQADLFQIETPENRGPAPEVQAPESGSSSTADRYRFDGQWRAMTVFRETIRVKDQEPIEITVRETHLGPVASEFCFTQPGEPEIVLKRIPVCETDRETVKGAIRMLRAGTARQFDEALGDWRFPSANVVFADREGNVGYRAVGAIPVRSRLDPAHGRKARPGHVSEQDWREILPAELMPGVMNPAAGFVYSGNHRPIESWYPLPLGAMTGTGGDTLRSWRLRERLAERERFTPQDVLDIHFDAVNPARRDIVRLGLLLRDQVSLQEDAAQALRHLEPWYRGGADTTLSAVGSELALELNTFFRFVNTDLAYVYGGGESGLAYFLKTATERLEQDPQTVLSPRERQFIERALADAWQSAFQKYGPDPAAWNTRAREAVQQRQLGYYEGLDGFPALDPAQAMTLPALARIDGGTIGCQTAQSYTQWVPMHDPDSARTILPPGQSEWPDSPARASTRSLWSESQLHPAPLSRTRVEELTASRTTLERPAGR